LRAVHEQEALLLARRVSLVEEALHLLEGNLATSERRSCVLVHGLRSLGPFLRFDDRCVVPNLTNDVVGRPLEAIDREDRVGHSLLLLVWLLSLRKSELLCLRLAANRNSLAVNFGDKELCFRLRCGCGPLLVELVDGLRRVPHGELHRLVPELHAKPGLYLLRHLLE